MMCLLTAAMKHPCPPSPTKGRNRLDVIVTEPLHLLTTFQDMPGTEGCVQSYRMNLVSQEWGNVIEKNNQFLQHCEGGREERSVHKLRNQRTVCQPSGPSEDGLQPGPNKQRSEYLRILRSCCHILGVLILWYNHIKEKRSYSL